MICAESPAVNLQLAQDLDAVTDLVSRGPCVGAAARDDGGRTVRVDSPTAMVFCPMGAAMRVTRGVTEGDLRYLDLMEALHYELGPHTAIASWADRHQWNDVVALCRRAAQRARGLL